MGKVDAGNVAKVAEASTKELIERISKPGAWKNTKTISIGGVEFPVRDVLITAPLIAGLNVYYVGGTGEGKTQLAHDISGLFGKSACYAIGRNDFEPKQLFTLLNLNFKGATTDKDLVQLTENVSKCFFYVDELNRCLPIVQNGFFDFFDGRYVHTDGRIYKLGSRGYSAGFASGNIGDGAYVGIQDSDRALKDRMHLIVKIDYPDFHTIEEDDGELFEVNKDPRASLPEESEGCLEEILELHKRFRRREEIPLVWPALGIYFHKGLDYLEQTPKHSKRAVDTQWPNIQAIRKDNDESTITPLSKRAIFGTMALGNALQMIAESRGLEVNETALYLDALRFTVPYSGVLSQQFVSQDYSGDIYSAFDAVMAHSRSEITARLDAIKTAVAFAACGQSNSAALESISKTGAQDRWTPVRRYVEGMVKKPARINIEDIMRRAKALREVRKVA